jgi:hypothetical protein
MEPEKDLLEMHGFSSVATRKKRFFLKGPVPIWWLQKAASLPGSRALAVACCLWYLAGRYKTSRVRLTSVQLKEWGVNRKAKSRALLSLERAGLIAVENLPGKNSVVTILKS